MKARKAQLDESVYGSNYTQTKQHVVALPNHQPINLAALTEIDSIVRSETDSKKT